MTLTALSEGLHGPYDVCGWKMLSAMPLPELRPWRGDNQPTDVFVTCDDVLPEPQKSWLSLNEQGVLQLAFKGVTITVPESGSRIELHVEQGNDPLQTRNYFYGSGLAALCYRHGFLPLHGSAVRIGDQAVIFSGDSGAGKSTLATAMARHGHRLLSDDVCAIEFRDGQSPMLRPAFPRVKLLADTIDGFGFEAETVYTESPRGTKGHFGMVPMDSGEEIASLPVAAIYMLREPQGEEIHARPIKGHDAFQLVGSQVHRSEISVLLGQRGKVFQQLANLLSSVPVYALERPRDFDLLARTVEYLAHACTMQEARGEGTLAL